MTKSMHELIEMILTKQDSWKVRLIQHWPTIVGELIQHVTIEKIEEESITLGVFDASWLQELYLLSPHILNSINAKLDHAPIKRLRFKQVARKRAVPQTKKLKQENNCGAILLNGKEKEALMHIEDKELRESLKKFLLRCHQENV